VEASQVQSHGQGHLPLTASFDQVQSGRKHFPQDDYRLVGSLQQRALLPKGPGTSLANCLRRTSRGDVVPSSPVVRASTRRRAIHPRRARSPPRGGSQRVQGSRSRASRPRAPRVRSAVATRAVRSSADILASATAVPRRHIRASAIPGVDLGGPEVRPVAAVFVKSERSYASARRAPSRYWRYPVALPRTASAAAEPLAPCDRPVSGMFPDPSGRHPPEQSWCSRRS
jgi:hypothetical protein